MAYVQKGKTLLSNGNVEAAIASYDKAIELNPALAVAYLQRGYARRQQGSLDKAIADYEKATELDPRTTANNWQVAEAFTNRGLRRKDRFNVDAAISDYNQAIRFYPDALQAYLERGQARILLDDFAGAIDDFTHVIEKEKRDQGRRGLAYADRSLAKLFLGKEEEAKRDFEEGRRLGIENKIDTESHLIGLEIQLRRMREIKAQRNRGVL
ncbi:MAG TPA: tetratricopeptide repeat protein [Pyrinomonadaceae bacterium]|jgi:tetratricopeptide (TPR) repeat protein